MQLPDRRYLFGRIVRTDANCFAPGCILVYVFRYTAREPHPPPRLLVRDLLIPPCTINRLGWSRGYLMTVVSRPFEEGERLPAHYFLSSQRAVTGEARYLDEDQRPAGDPPLDVTIGTAGLGNYRTLDDDISEALGIPLSPG